MTASNVIKKCLEEFGKSEINKPKLTSLVKQSLLIVNDLDTTLNCVNERILYHLTVNCYNNAYFLECYAFAKHLHSLLHGDLSPSLKKIVPHLSEVLHKASCKMFKSNTTDDLVLDFLFLSLKFDVYQCLEFKSLLFKLVDIHQGLKKKSPLDRERYSSQVKTFFESIHPQHNVGIQKFWFATLYMMACTDFKDLKAFQTTFAEDEIKCIKYFKSNDSRIITILKSVQNVETNEMNTGQMLFYLHCLSNFKSTSTACKFAICNLCRNWILNCNSKSNVVLYCLKEVFCFYFTHTMSFLKDFKDLDDEPKKYIDHFQRLSADLLQIKHLNDLKSYITDVHCHYIASAFWNAYKKSNMFQFISLSLTWFLEGFQDAIEVVKCVNNSKFFEVFLCSTFKCKTLDDVTPLFQHFKQLVGIFTCSSFFEFEKQVIEIFVKLKEKAMKYSKESSICKEFLFSHFSDYSTELGSKIEVSRIDWLIYESFRNLRGVSEGVLDEMLDSIDDNYLVLFEKQFWALNASNFDTVECMHAELLEMKSPHPFYNVLSTLMTVLGNHLKWVADADFNKSYFVQYSKFEDIYSSINSLVTTINDYYHKLGSEALKSIVCKNTSSCVLILLSCASLCSVLNLRLLEVDLWKLISDCFNVTASNFHGYVAAFRSQDSENLKFFYKKMEETVSLCEDEKLAKLAFDLLTFCNDMVFKCQFSHKVVVNFKELLLSPLLMKPRISSFCMLAEIFSFLSLLASVTDTQFVFPLSPVEILIECVKQRIGCLRYIQPQLLTFSEPKMGLLWTNIKGFYCGYLIVGSTLYTEMMLCECLLVSHCFKLCQFYIAILQKLAYKMGSANYNCYAALSTAMLDQMHCKVPIQMKSLYNLVNIFSDGTPFIIIQEDSQKIEENIDIPKEIIEKMFRLLQHSNKCKCFKCVDAEMRHLLFRSHALLNKADCCKYIFMNSIVTSFNSLEIGDSNIAEPQFRSLDTILKFCEAMSKSVDETYTAQFSLSKIGFCTPKMKTAIPRSSKSTTKRSRKCKVWIDNETDVACKPKTNDHRIVKQQSLSLNLSALEIGAFYNYSRHVYNAISLKQCFCINAYESQLDDDSTRSIGWLSKVLGISFSLKVNVVELNHIRKLDKVDKPWFYNFFTDLQLLEKKQQLLDIKQPISETAFISYPSKCVVLQLVILKVGQIEQLHAILTDKSGILCAKQMLELQASDVLKQFDEIIKDTKTIVQETSSRQFWKLRETSDNKLLTLLTAIERLCGDILPALLSKLTTTRFLVLILDRGWQRLPWESLPSLRDKICCRFPSVSAFLNSAKTFGKDHTVSFKNTFFVLNPNHDLARTQKTFEQLFLKEYSWSGIIDRPPTTEELIKAFANYDMYVYCGHGAGRRFIDSLTLRNSICKSIAILMGCASGHIEDEGMAEMHGVPFDYILAGAPAVVANLWDVTDGEIDRYLRQCFDVITSSRQAKIRLGEVITKSRNGCKLPYLTGAAPVIYGLPSVCFK